MDYSKVSLNKGLSFESNEVDRPVDRRSSKLLTDGLENGGLPADLETVINSWFELPQQAKDSILKLIRKYKDKE